jgi:hypothetical protein
MNNVQGEGDHEAARRFNDAEENFVKSGRVGPAAEEAAPKDDEEAKELEQAEQIGRDKAKEEDPQVSGREHPQAE